jgi:hypothetical protein
VKADTESGPLAGRGDFSGAGGLEGGKPAIVRGHGGG